MINKAPYKFMKYFLFFVLLLISQTIYAQNSIDSSNEFRIAGKVKAEKTITLQSLQRYKTVELKDVNTSCSPKKQEKALSVKAVLLKDILDSVAFQYEKPRMLNQYYFLFAASDGYKMVFSFNEIYNTETGNNLYIVTEMNGVKAENMDSKILVLATKDIKSGTRNMKWLSKITVCSAE
jgi:hypothetical protein